MIKAAREKAGLSQNDLARQLRFSSPQFVSNWERGISLPPMDHLPKLITLLKIPQRTLIENIHRYQEELLKIEKRKVSALFREYSHKSS